MTMMADPIKQMPTLLPPPPEPLSDSTVRERAFQIYLTRGDRPGDAVSDWLQAEAELRAERSARPTRTRRLHTA